MPRESGIYSTVEFLGTDVVIVTIAVAHARSQIHSNDT